MNTPEIEQERRAIWGMFDRIAPTYDQVNRLVSFGRDRAWRAKLEQHLPDGRGLSLLDLATGTGDQLLALCQTGRFAEAVGMDMSEGMLAVGREKVAAAGFSGIARLELGDATAIPAPDARFDVVTVSFGIRNVVHVARALAEIQRVLRPGGRALILEFSLPSSAVARWGHLLYLRHLLPRVGGAISGDLAAYRYLNTTIEAFPYGESFCALMRAAGFLVVEAHPLTFGVATLYEGRT